MQSISTLARRLGVLALAAISITGCGGGTSTSSSSQQAATTIPSTPTATPTPAPSTPASTTISNIEQMSGWDSCDTCAGGGTISYSMTQGITYPQPGTTRFSIGSSTTGAGTPWAHALWWNRLGTDTQASHFVLTLDQYMENPSASWGLEYNVNQIFDGSWYYFAAQCSFGLGIWQLWDPLHQVWVPSSVPCAPQGAYTHRQLRLEFERSNGQARFVSIGVDGQIYPVGVAFSPQAISGTNGDFGVHFQMNANGQPDPYSVWIHNLALTYW